MRVKLVVLAATLVVLVVIAGLGNPARARLQEEASPAAEAPAAASPATEAEPAADEPTIRVVTLVAWYTPDESGDFLVFGPIRTNANLVAGPAEPGERDITGRVDFDSPRNDELPRITFDTSIFNAYPVFEDDPESVQRWIYTDDDPSLRPATLVMQIVAVRGPYDGFAGTATFVSRASEAGGVLIIVLNPPAEEEAE